MLDDLKYIHQRDGQDALGIAEKQPEQLVHDFKFTVSYGDIDNVVFAGMGGSAIAGLMSRSWPAHNKVPFEVCRQYTIPGYVGKNTLFIASSYSGNTEETVDGLAQAEAKGAKIVVIAGGGKLIETAQAKSYPHIVLPKVGQPRYAVFYSFNALVKVLETVGLVDAGSSEQLKKAAPFLDNAKASWLPTVRSDDNAAKKLALELAGKSIVIYAGPLMSPAAYKWKISFNENAKNIAWWNEAPEWNHNETSGWLEQPVQKPYAVVDLRSNLENQQVQKRFELLARLLSGKRPAPEIVQAEGSNVLEQMLCTIMFGDFTSLYLALANNVNPSPVDVQERIKKELV
ncbi:MAG TPA: bifunctional phosphoglucose/phosphomannose isomerase [Candidatus Saccharimonadales bacterium]|nr:bifunctional phosphoglucose/phosphomannose isomerase [Candidatus Saccharimonadales bacterium]